MLLTSVHDASRPLVFFGGKGGVGKTTVAAAVAGALGRSGASTLLVSTDPAHSTGDLLATALSDEPAPVGDRLWAVEVDAEAHARRHVERIKEDAAASFPRDLLPAIERHLDLAVASPGTVESALFDRVVDLFEQCPDPYERVVFDTAPTGHTLRLLALPALMSAWVEGLVRQREKVAGTERMLRNLAGRDEPGDDPILARLRDRRRRYGTARERLLGEAVFHLVLVPERLPIEETARAAATLSSNGVHVGALVVNRVLPDDAEGDFVAARRRQEADYLDEIAHRFRDLPAVHVTQQPQDVTTPGQLEQVAAQLAPLAGGSPRHPPM